MGFFGVIMVLNVTIKEIKEVISVVVANVSFELGPSRPPSEARSLLLRLTRSCPWNRCEFCSTNKRRKFSVRTVEEVKKDIETVKIISDVIKGIAVKQGYGEDLKRIAAYIINNPPNDSFRVVATWMYFGSDKVFLQDANSLVMPTKDLVEILKFLKQTLPTVTRVTSYGRSKTAARKSQEDLNKIREAGLTRLHVGLESGHDEVLKYVQKGATAAEHVEAGQKVVASGISLSEYVMPGLGGRRWSQEHAVETARVLNAVNPDFIRLRSLVLREDLPLFHKMKSGEFELLTDDEVVAEIKLFINELSVTSRLLSDHIENLLPEVEGKLPEDKEKIVAVIDRYLALPEEEKLNYRVGRRAGYYEQLDDLNDPIKRAAAKNIMRWCGKRGEDVEEFIFNLKKGFIV